MKETKVKLSPDATSNKISKPGKLGGPPAVLFKRSTTTIGSEFTKLYTEKTSKLTKTESESNLIAKLSKMPHLEPITNDSNSSLVLFPKRGISEKQFQVKYAEKDSI